jgi:hypothetical protein
MTGLIDALLGPLGGLLAGVVAVVGALILGRWQGASSAREKRAGQDARDYQNERREIDNQDLGIGASDAERQRMLSDIAKRRG